MSLTKKLSVLVFSGVLLALSACAGTQNTQGTAGYIDDSAITVRVKAAIFNEPTLRSAEINVESFKGVVQLSGFVSTREQTVTAVEVTRRVQGVVSVKNDMRLK
jgi:osmotically-inducible protein OsmY